MLFAAAHESVIGHFATCCIAARFRSQTGRSGHSASRADYAGFMSTRPRHMAVGFIQSSDCAKVGKVIGPVTCAKPDDRGRGERRRNDAASALLVSRHSFGPAIVLG
jgi:hypothetical protein